MYFKPMLMMQHACDDKLFNDDSFPSPTPHVADGYLLSLLRQPPIETQPPVVPSQPSHLHPPLTFEDPFDDPEMEPLPLKLQDSVPDLVQLPSSDSTIKRDDYLVSPSFAREPSVVEVDQCTNAIMEPLVGHAGSKRNSVDDHDDGPVKAKRERTDLDRFRPYQEKQWREQFQKLVDYKNKTGHCCVPHPFPEDITLSRWVKRQRYQYKKVQNNLPNSTMTRCRIKELESIGFVWNSHAAIWQQRLDELKLFKQKRGHCKVPSHFPENVALSTWVKCQRRQWRFYESGSRTSSMTVERLQALDALGFLFETTRTSAKIK